MKKTICIVDDDEIEIEAMQRAFQKIPVENGIEVKIFNDGKEFIAKMKEVSTQSGAGSLPILIFLDINMPLMDGFEILSEIRDDPELKSLVTFMLSTSINPSDIKKAYRHNVAGYLVKTEMGNHYEKLTELVQYYSKVVVPEPL